VDDKDDDKNNKMLQIVVDLKIHDLIPENHSLNHPDEVVQMTMNSHPL
jgi:hypothetical protein